MFPTAVEMPLDTTLQLALYTALILVIILVVCVLAAWRIIHLRHIRKLKEISKRERIVALGIEDLQVSPMGESTIKVTIEAVTSTDLQWPPKCYESLLNFGLKPPKFGVSGQNSGGYISILKTSIILS